jgi:hypothetical protein
MRVQYYIDTERILTYTHERRERNERYDPSILLRPIYIIQRLPVKLPHANYLNASRVVQCKSSTKLTYDNVGGSTSKRRNATI